MIDLTKPLVKSFNGDDLLIIFEKGGSKDYQMVWSGKVVGIYAYSNGSYGFMSNSSSDTVEKIEDARVWYEFSYCWRGVWEGRIYFKDGEYWSEDIDTIKESWDWIEETLKEQIKADNPDYGHFD